MAWEVSSRVAPACMAVRVLESGRQWDAPSPGASPAHTQPQAGPVTESGPWLHKVSQEGLQLPGPQLGPALWTPNIWLLVSRPTDGPWGEKALENTLVWSPPGGPKPSSSHICKEEN